MRARVEKGLHPPTKNDSQSHLSILAYAYIRILVY